MRRPSLRNLQDLIGAGFWLVAVELEHLRKGQHIMAATLEDLTSDVNVLVPLVQTAVDILKSGPVAGTLTPEQQAQVDALDGGLKDLAAKLTDAENPPA